MVALLSTGEPALMFLGFLGAMLSFITMFAVVAAYLPELYEPRVRCTGAAVGYNLGGVLGGALTPIVATALTGHAGRVPWGVAAYLTTGPRQPGLLRSAAGDPSRAGRGRGTRSRLIRRKTAHGTRAVSDPGTRPTGAGERA
ncbi:hypothetical protein E4K10_10670 [Streptomyces sp. T1317-0309]|nr:hypothetical protein E4K10_10670 [Streptomyces sp. T1317-0309]